MRLTIQILIFGDEEPLEFCGMCRGGWSPLGDPAKTIRENVAQLSARLHEEFGNGVDCRFIDVNSPAMQEYPKLAGIIRNLLLPVVILEGVSLSHGYIDQQVIIDQVRDKLQKKGSLTLM